MLFWVLKLVHLACIVKNKIAIIIISHVSTHPFRRRASAQGVYARSVIGKYTRFRREIECDILRVRPAWHACFITQMIFHLLIAANWQPLLFTKLGLVADRARVCVRHTSALVITELTYVSASFRDADHRQYITQVEGSLMWYYPQRGISRYRVILNFA